MTTLNLQATQVCASGGHVEITATLGPRQRVVHIHRDDVFDAVTDEELEAAIAVLLRIYSIGKTPVQVRDGLQAGVDVVVP